MRRPAVAALAVLFLACGGEASSELSSAQLALGGGAGSATLCVFTTQLLPENEVRPDAVTDPVTSVASGHAQVKVRADGTLEYKVFIRNPAEETFTAGHIHPGGPGQNLPPVVQLFGPPAEGTTFTDEIFVQHAVAAPAQFLGSFTDATTICDDPANFYVNYHTTADPMGAIRGQLR